MVEQVVETRPRSAMKAKKGCFKIFFIRISDNEDFDIGERRTIDDAISLAKRWHQSGWILRVSDDLGNCFFEM